MQEIIQDVTQLFVCHNQTRTYRHCNFCQLL